MATVFPVPGRDVRRQRAVDRWQDQVRAVRDLTRLGWDRDRICRLLKISAATYYRRCEELSRLESEARGLSPVGAVA